jgi:ABC-type proline/glycine betaine transport system permease subunit
MIKGFVGTGVTIGTAAVGSWTQVVTLGFQWTSYAVSIVVGVLTAIWWIRKLRKDK